MGSENADATLVRSPWGDVTIRPLAQHYYAPSMAKGVKLHNTRRHDGANSDDWVSAACGHCGNKAVLAILTSTSPIMDGSPRWSWMRCPTCLAGSVMSPDTGAVWPAASLVPRVEGLPADVERAFAEASDCFAVGAHVACELVCRKILMHVAVEKGAKEGETFAAYITHLEKAGYVTPPMTPWVELIRSHGNAATHELRPVDKQRAEGTVMFTAELLRLVYEMAAMTERYAPADD